MTPVPDEQNMRDGAQPGEDQTLRDASETLLRQLEADEQASESIRQFVLTNVSHPALGLTYVDRVEEIARRRGFVYALAVSLVMRFWFLYISELDAAMEANEEARRVIAAVPGYEHTPAYLSILNNAVLGYSLRHDYIGAYRNAAEGITLVDPEHNARTYCALLNNTAAFLSEIGLHQKALRQLELSMEYLSMLPPATRVVTQFRYADALAQNGRLEEAEALFQKLIERHSDIFPWQIYPSLMRIAYMRGDGNALDSWYERMIRQNPFDGEESFDQRNAGFAVALRHVFHGRFEEAENVFLQVLESGGAAMMSQYDLVREAALLYSRWGKPEKACTYYRMLDEMHQHAMSLADEIFAFEDEAGGRNAFSRASAALYRRIRRLSVLGQRITACLDYTGVRVCLVEELGDICPFDALELAVRNERTGRFYPAEQLSAGREEERASWDHYGTVVQCLAQSAPLKMADVSAQRDTLPPLPEIGAPTTGSILLVPIRYQTQVLGMLYLYHHVTAFYEQEHQDTVETLCSSLGIALHIIDQYQNAVLTSLTDPLTGIHNRAGLFRHEADLRARCGGQAAVLLLDIDEFKQINDACGHEGGDQVLQAVGSALRDWAGDGVACRYGGDEFLVLLPAIEAGALSQRAQELCDTIAGRVRRPDGLPLSISVGAYALSPDQPLAEAVASADSLLYRAKKEGKNRACTSA